MSKKINICGYEFSIYSDPEEIEKKSGVYIILCIVDRKVHCILDIGFSGNLNQRVKYHGRKKCWDENKHRKVIYAILYISNLSKIIDIENELQWKLEYVCGDNYWKNVERAWQEYKEYEKRFGKRGQSHIQI